MVSLGLPEDWPVSRPTIFLESNLADGLVLLGAVPTGQLQVELRAEGEQGPICTARSPALRLSGAQPVVITIVWGEGRIVRFDLSKHDLLAGGDEISLTFTPAITDLADFSQKNEQARMNRYSVVQNLPFNPRRKLGGDAYMYAALRGEIEQIEDLASAIQSGKEAHIPGLAARIRLLVIGKPIGLLQHCAALSKLPLIVYSDRNPESLPPISDGLAILGGVSSQPDRFYCNPVDLDVWLNFPALKVAQTIFSHREAIKDIGDTIGSHRDPGIPQSVQVLQLNRSQMGPVYRDVQRYVLEVADAVLSLARHVLSQAEGSEAQ